MVIQILAIVISTAALLVALFSPVYMIMKEKRKGHVSLIVKNDRNFPIVNFSSPECIKVSLNHASKSLSFDCTDAFRDTVKDVSTYFWRKYKGDIVDKKEYSVSIVICDRNNISESFLFKSILYQNNSDDDHRYYTCDIKPDSKPCVTVKLCIVRIQNGHSKYKYRVKISWDS